MGAWFLLLAAEAHFQGKALQLPWQSRADGKHRDSPMPIIITVCQKYVIIPAKSL